MRAEYILKSLQAMTAAYQYLESHCKDAETARERGCLLADLFIARSALEAASGLNEVQVSVEKEVA